MRRGARAKRGVMDGRGAEGLWAEPADGPSTGQGLTDVSGAQ